MLTHTISTTTVADVNKQYGTKIFSSTLITNGKLTKINDGGADHGYYVIYLPAAAHETDAAKNSFLTNTGLFDTTAYAASGISHTMVGVDSNGDRESQFYDIKVYSRSA